MKKIIIAAAIVLTSGVTALSITRSSNKAEVLKANVEKTNLATKIATGSTSVTLATAD
ncbi:MAG TPA: hypothetical protein VGC01_12465 [Mucilaginibacter sp.]